MSSSVVVVVDRGSVSESPESVEASVMLMLCSDIVLEWCWHEDEAVRLSPLSNDDDE